MLHKAATNSRDKALATHTYTHFIPKTVPGGEQHHLWYWWKSHQAPHLPANSTLLHMGPCSRICQMPCQGYKVKAHSKTSQVLWMSPTTEDWEASRTWEEMTEEEENRLHWCWWWMCYNYLESQCNAIMMTDGADDHQRERCPNHLFG